MTDDDKTEDSGGAPPTPPTEEAPTREARPVDAEAGPSSRTVPGGARRLLRSRDDRVIVGVAGGLGRYFEIDPVIVRIAFAVTILFGGLGIVAYLAAALFVPSDDGTGSPAPPSRTRDVARVLGVGLLVIAVLGGFGALIAGAVFVTGIGYGLAVVASILLIGIALIALSFRGGAKWLIVPAVALICGVGVAAAADLDLEGGIGERHYQPATAAAIPAGGYELGVGRLAVDLRDLDWSPERILDLGVRLGVGELVIAVPAHVCVAADAHVGAGDMRIAGQQSNGLDVDSEVGSGAAATPRLTLDADADLGAIYVVNDDTADIGDGHHDEWFDDSSLADDSAAREANERACAG